VIKSCIKTLNILGAHDIIHNVTFLAGAISFDNKEEKWGKILSETVNGKVRNIYTAKDEALKLFWVSMKKSAAGSMSIFNLNPQNMAKV